MDKIKKIRICVDITMAALFLLLLNAGVTGVLLHEALGMAITVLFMLHLVLNRQWIAGITRNFRGVRPKVRAAYIFDAVIAITTGIAILSGILISRFLFLWLALEDTGLMYDVHIVSSWLAFAFIIVHTILHLRWIKGILLQFAKQAARLKTIASKAVIGLIAAAAVYSIIANDSLYSLLSPSAQNGTGAQVKQTADDTDNAVLAPSDGSGSTGTRDVTVTASPAAIDQVSLEEFLGKLYCTACHRRCPLTNPQCSIGVQQAEEQTAVYYTQYGQE